MRLDISKGAREDEWRMARQVVRERDEPATRETFIVDVVP